MKLLSRRDVLRSGVLGLIAYASSTLPAVGLLAAGGTALLAAPPGRLGPHLEGLRGMKVCAGGQAAQASSGYPELLRARGATIVSLPLPERFEALQRGVCGALLFISTAYKSYDQLAEEVRVFFRLQGQYEFRPFP